MHLIKLQLDTDEVVELVATNTVAAMKFAEDLQTQAKTEKFLAFSVEDAAYVIPKDRLVFLSITRYTG